VTRILIMVRDRRLGMVVKQGLRAHGCQAVLISHPGTASALVDYEGCDLVIVDMALQGTEGFDLLRESCAGPAGPSVIRVDTEGEPVDAEALLARARSLIARPERAEKQKLAAGGVELDPWKRRARVDDVEVALTEREFSLLRTFLRHPGRVLSREELHLRAWGQEHQVGSNAVEVYVGYLRRKLGAELIDTVRGRGYRLVAEPRFPERGV
jgi:two-component system, OmpR family, response regulator